MSVREDRLLSRINNFLGDEKDRQLTLMDPTRRVLRQRRETVYMDKSPRKGSNAFIRII